MGNDDELLTFTKRLIEAWLGQLSQEPVAEVTGSKGLTYNGRPVLPDGTKLFLASQLAIPEGYVLVPKEPSGAILNALYYKGCDLYDSQLTIAYKTMIAAAQGE